MARNRKAGTKSLSASETQLEISEEEQWRLINDTGILKQPISRPKQSEDEEDDTPLGEEIFNSVILIVPFSCLLLMMDILIHTQYGRQPTFQALADRMISSVPIISIFIFYSTSICLTSHLFGQVTGIVATRYKQHRSMQFLLFLLSIVVGPRMVYLVNRGSWLVNMRQCPPLATIWVYTIVQLDLGPAVLNLMVVGTWVWWKGMKLVF